MKAWCAEQNLTVHQLKYWLYKAQRKRPASSAMTFRPDTVPPPSIHIPPDSLHIQIGVSRIKVCSGFEPELLRDVVTALSPFMLSLTSDSPVYLACGATDMRKSIDGFAAIVQEQFALGPFSPALFVFCNRRRDRID